MGYIVDFNKRVLFMDLFDKHFDKTKIAILELEQNLELLKNNARVCVEQKNELDSKVEKMKEEINNKVLKIEKIIDKLDGALK